MPNQEPTEKVQTDSDNYTPQIPPSTDNPTGTNTKTKAEDGESSKIDSLQKSVRDAERWMIWFTGALAFFALCSVVVGLLQWNSMNGQLAELRSSSSDTHELAMAAKTQAVAAGI